MEQHIIRNWAVKKLGVLQIRKDPLGTNAKDPNFEWKIQNEVLDEATEFFGFV